MIPPLPLCLAGDGEPRVSPFQLLRVIVSRDLWRPPRETERERGIVHEYFFLNEITGEVDVRCFKLIYIYICMYISYTGINYVEQGIHEGNQTTLGDTQRGNGYCA